MRILRYGLISTGLYGATRLILKNEESENIYSKEQEAILRAGERFGIYDRRLEEEYPIFDHREAGENGSLFETTLVHTKGQDVVILREDRRKCSRTVPDTIRRGRSLTWTPTH